MPAGSLPPGAFQGNLPPIPSEPEGGLGEGQEPVSEPPIGWPIVGVISRATGKAAADTFKIYKGHEHVDEWQFHVFDRGEQVQVPGNPGMAPRPTGLGPGFGEELLFRGYIQTRLRQRWPRLVALAVTACLFGFIHFDLVQGAFAVDRLAITIDDSPQQFP